MMLFRSIFLAALLVPLGACHTIPPPTLQVATARSLSRHSTDGLAAPRQKGWQWDANRWFDAEIDHRCVGEIYFVDPKNGIDSYVGHETAPNLTFDSDDPDVVFGAVGAFEQLIYSTDGGRHFLREVRGFPTGPILEFLAVRKGHVYAGFQNVGRNADGYFKWERSDLPWGAKERVFLESSLVILEAKLDKSTGRIGEYVLLAPRDYQFRQEVPAQATSHIKRVEYIEALNLPHRETTLPIHACKETMQVPPWHFSWRREDLVEFLTWYETTTRAYPGWANAEKDAFVESIRIKYKKNQ